MGGAVNGIYGNSEAEAMYPLLALDNKGQKLDGTNDSTDKMIRTVFLKQQLLLSLSSATAQEEGTRLIP